MAKGTQHLIRRVGRYLPENLRDFARVVLAARSGSPIVEVPDASSVLVVGAHPDDETALAGGTIAGLVRRGARVEVVLATAGEATAATGLSETRIRESRTVEAELACDILGAQPPTVLHFPDGALADHVEGFSEVLEDVISRVQPELIFVPWWLDDHPDHRAAAAAVASTPLRSSTSIWSGEIWTPLVPNRIVDVSHTIEVKKDALAAHRIAMEAIDLDAFIGLNRYRSLSGLSGDGYAEAFVVADPEAYRECVRG